MDKPRVLFLDDMHDRHERFLYQNNGKWDVVQAYSYEDYLEVIEEHEYLLLFLDHDLSENAIMCDIDNIDERTGTDVVRDLIPRFEGREKPGVIVHSLNPPGRRRMAEELRDAGWDAKEFPFYHLCPAPIFT